MCVRKAVGNIALWACTGCFVYFTFIYGLFTMGKGKTIPLQAWTGPEASRRLRLPDFKTVGT